MFGIGVGMHKELASGNHYDLNFNLIDTGFDPVRGRVAGESDNHYAITVDFSFHWR